MGGKYSFACPYSRVSNFIILAFKKSDFIQDLLSLSRVMEFWEFTMQLHW